MIWLGQVEGEDCSSPRKDEAGRGEKKVPAEKQRVIGIWIF
jgi:hypothetical protein